MDTVATLWIGPTLSFLERLSLKSFYDIGQKPILYLYDEVDDPPDDYAEIRDAREVMDENFTREHWGVEKLSDPRVHSDIFRVLLMRKTDHIWIDADVYALHPHIATDGYLFAPRKRNFVPNGVIRTPRNSPAIIEMEKFVSQPGAIPPWWTQEQVEAHREAGGNFSFEELPVGVTGPEAFGYFIYATGEHKHKKPFSYLYPIAARHSTMLLLTPPPYSVDDLRENSMSLHLYASGIRRKLTRRGQKGVPPEGCMLDLLCKAHGIDASAHPITHRDSEESARLHRKFRDLKLNK